jgi:hypothetical protein
MRAITTDHRRIDVDPDLGAHESAVSHARSFVEAQLLLARDLLRIDATRTYTEIGCASIEEYGVRIGVSATDARRLVDLGRSLDVAPPSTVNANSVPPANVEEAVRQGLLSAQKASLAGRLLGDPRLLRPDENAVDLVAKSSVRRILDLIRERREECALGRPVTPITLAVTHEAKEDFARARAVASVQSGRMLTDGETFGVVVEHYLDQEDPLRRGEAPRRLADTCKIPESRTVPAAVERAVRLRADERCEVPACPNRTFLQFAHAEPHRDGGSREADNIVRLCTRHHLLFDAGVIRLAGWDGGRPSFRDRSGRVLDENSLRKAEEIGAAPP